MYNIHNCEMEIEKDNKQESVTEPKPSAGLT